MATLLMLAQAVADDPAALAEVLRILKLPRPIITIVGKVRGFEGCFLDMLRSGMILPGKVAIASGHEIHRDGSLRFSRDEDVRSRAVAFASRWFDPDDADKTDWRVGRAAMDAFPILGVAEDESRLPERLRRAAQLNLACGPLNGTIIGDTMAAVLGEETKDGLSQVDCSLLTLSDLAIAIRPGVSVTSAWDVLANIAGERRKSVGAGEGSNGGNESTSSSSSKTQASNATKTGRGKEQSSGSEIIQPAKLTGGEQDRFIPRVETLTGYGEARDWSLSLQADLALWREGRLAWEVMTTKLLLAGPPGTGKTSFARALCNTLQIPLIVTSVATWLEPGYLGDVLRRMKAAFTEAEANKPAILFVDEIDGIGKRGNASRSYDEYWTSFINQALTLLDGASKSSGVIIVGATNNPDAIDPALLRSGRLEKHIVIPRPNTDALIGILRHHLRADLDAVIASAPTQAPARAATAASVSEPGVDRAQASIASDGRTTGPKRDTVMTDPVDDEAPATSPQVTAKQARANRQGRRGA
ncbi:ATP-binding protein [Mesorhizobium sp. M0040]|uniref:ATP-binding protein n=1 Tax=Mesorhizobium sp. M0040 TaxID=2956855 RepID=UPI003338D436